MKLILFICLLAASAVGAATNQLKLSWYTTNDDWNITNLSFNVYTQTNVDTPLDKWALYTNVDFVTATNTFAPGEAGVNVPAAANYQQFFVVTASNIFGEGDFSDPVFSRRLSRGTGLRIGVR